MVKDIIATKMELGADKDYYPKTKKRCEGKSLSLPPEGEGLLSYLMKTVRSEVDGCDKEEEDYFKVFLQSGSPKCFRTEYKVNGKEYGMVKFLNRTHEALDIYRYSREVMLYFLAYSDSVTDLCFLCSSFLDGSPYEGLDIVPLKLRLVNVYKDGRTEVVVPKGRLMLINTDFPNGRY